jgi:hypothetical protein
MKEILLMCIIISISSNGNVCINVCINMYEMCDNNKRNENING